jgi:hypothetical protein
MSDSPRTLGPRPDLRRLRDEAKQRRRQGEFATLAIAHFAIAREHGFASWPALKFHVEALTLDAGQRAQALVRSACSGDLRRARALLETDPALARREPARRAAWPRADPLRLLLASGPRRRRAG